jgi:hypothetical protein
MPSSNPAFNKKGREKVSRSEVPTSSHADDFQLSHLCIRPLTPCYQVGLASRLGSGSDTASSLNMSEVVVSVNLLANTVFGALCG